MFCSMQVYFPSSCQVSMHYTSIYMYIIYITKGLLLLLTTIIRIHTRIHIRNEVGAQ